MRIVLIRPPFPQKNMAVSAEPLGIAYLAAYLREYYPGADIKILDAHIENLSQDGCLRRLSSIQPELVGLSYLTVQADFAYQLSRQIKKTFPQVFLVHGGVHPTCVWDEAVDYADYCVLGEGELTFYELINAIENKAGTGNISGLCFKKDGGIIRTPPREFLSNIDRIPYPAWDLLPMEKYQRHSIHVIAGRAIGIMASRGCPFNCSFCASPIFWKQNVRFRSAANIINEIKEILDNYGINKFHFYDDNFLFNRELVEDFCNLILKEGINIFWACLGSVSLIKANPGVLKLMHKAGCRAIELGIESFDDTILAQLGKHQNTNDILQVFGLIKESGIKPLMLLMTFNPGETISSWYLQVKGLRQIEPQASLFLGQFATPYPRTGFDNNSSRLGIKLVEEWKDYSTSQINFIPFSLLKDVPQTSSAKLSGLFLAKIIATSLNDNGSWGRFTPIKKIDAVFLWAGLVISFYEHCQANPTIEQIANNMAKEYAMDINLSLKAVSFICILMAQLGLIKSKFSDIPVTPYAEFINKFGKKKIILQIGSQLIFILAKILKNLNKKRSRACADLITELFGPA